MFSGSAFGELAFSDHIDSPLDTAAFQAFLDDPDAERCWLLEIDAFSLASSSARSSAFGDAGFGELGFSDADAGVTGGVQTLRYSTPGYTSRLFEEVAYVSLPGIAANYVSAPDSATLSVTGDLDVAVKVGLDDWTPAAAITLIGQYNTTGNQRAWELGVSAAGLLRVALSSSGAADLATQEASSVAVAFTDTAPHWVRFTRASATGVLKYYTGTEVDGTLTWTQLGADRSSTAGALFDSAAQLAIGARDAGTSQLASGRFYRAQLRNGIGGTLVASFNARRAADAATSAQGDGTAEAWTINTSGGTPARLYNEGAIAKGDPDSRLFYDGRLRADAIVVDRSIVGRDGVGGLTKVFAEAEMLNGDGGLDGIPVNYALDGRCAQIWVGRPTQKRADFGLLFSGVVESSTFGLKRVRLRLSDGAAKLDRPVNETIYAGTGGLEGGADLKGKRKPRGWGQVFNIAPPQVDSTKLIYQVNDGAISDVPAAYDRQIVLTQGADYASQADLEATAPAAGQYRVWKPGGYFRLGSIPAGTLTCDALLDASGAGYVSTTGAIVLRLLNIPPLYTSEVDTTSINQLIGDAPAAVGKWRGAGHDTTIAELIGELLADIGAFGGFSRQGTFAVGIIASASGKTPAATYTAIQIADLERESLPSAVDPIAWRVLVGYQRNYTVQSDLSATVTAARRTFATEALRVATAEDSSSKTRFLLAREYGPVAEYATEADADTEKARLLALWGTQRAAYRARLPFAALTRDIGQVIQLEHSRHGFSAGKQVRVLSHRVKGSKVEALVLA